MCTCACCFVGLFPPGKLIDPNCCYIMRAIAKRQPDLDSTAALAAVEGIAQALELAVRRC